MELSINESATINQIFHYQIDYGKNKTIYRIATTALTHGIIIIIHHLIFLLIIYY